MKKSVIYIMFILCLFLTSCGSSGASLETSFDVISELCKSNFAPSSQEEYENTYNKYKDTCISEQELKEFFDYGNKTVHTNVILTDYKCKYYLRANSINTRYEAMMHLSNNSVYTDIKVIFYIENGKIINISIQQLNK